MLKHLYSDLELELGDLSWTVQFSFNFDRFTLVMDNDYDLQQVYIFKCDFLISRAYQSSESDFISAHP